MTNGNLDPKAVLESGQRIDAIKQLIFGENMMEYDERFSEVIDKLKNTQKLLEKKINDLDSTMNKVVADLKTMHTKRMDKTDKQNAALFSKMEDSKTDRKALGKMMEQIGQKLQA